jgi:coenzyme F420-reducing hydrogenase delta subunit
MARHPIQPLEVAERGTLRFKANKIVQHLLDNGGIDLNQIAALRFSQEDQEQFAQLIGYSHSGAADLDYFSDETWQAALSVFEEGETETQARLENAEEQLDRMRVALREPIAELYHLHPDDLSETEK